MITVRSRPQCIVMTPPHPSRVRETLPGWRDRLDATLLDTGEIANDGVNARLDIGIRRPELEDVAPDRHFAVAVAGHVPSVDDATDALARKGASVAARELRQIGRRVSQLIGQWSIAAAGRAMADGAMRPEQTAAFVIHAGGRHL